MTLFFVICRLIYHSARVTYFFLIQSTLISQWRLHRFNILLIKQSSINSTIPRSLGTYGEKSGTSVSYSTIVLCSDYDSMQYSNTLLFLNGTSIKSHVEILLISSLHVTSSSKLKMATPHVAGVAALLWSHFPLCSNNQIRNALIHTASQPPTSDPQNTPGWDMVRR